MQRKTWFRIVFGTIISLVLMYFLISRVDLEETFRLFMSINLFWVAGVFALYVLTTALKGLRWRYVVNQKISRFEGFTYSAVHQMFLNLLPFRLGEASIFLMLQKKGIKIKSSVAYLVVLRLFDMVSMLAILFLAWILMREHMNPAINVAAIALFVFSLMVLLVLLFKTSWLVRLVYYVCNFAGISKNRIVKRVLKAGKETEIALRHLKSRSIVLFLLSFSTWMTGVLSLWFVLFAMGIQFPLAKTMGAVAVFIVLMTIPIQGMAGFGNYESFWTVGFVLVGMEENIAIMTGINAHIILLICSIVIGLFGFLAIAKTSATNKRKQKK